MNIRKLRRDKIGKIVNLIISRLLKLVKCIGFLLSEMVERERSDVSGKWFLEISRDA